MNTEVNKQTLSYLIYMANKWSYDESIELYGENLGSHIWEKYQKLINEFGLFGSYSMLGFELDDSNFQKLVDRAYEVYYGRSNR